MESKTKVFVNCCCVCDKEIEPSSNEIGIRSGYCSEECWNKWLFEHKDDAIFYPYVPLQISKIKL